MRSEVAKSNLLQNPFKRKNGQKFNPGSVIWSEKGHMKAKSGAQVSPRQTKEIIQLLDQNLPVRF